MAEHGFTPGKWEADDVRYQRDFRTFVNVMAPHGFVACVSSDPQHPETIAANARLIAAGPTLLEALKPFSAWDFTGTAWESANGHEAVLFDHKSGRAITLDDFRAVTAAITLATGKDA